MFRRCPCDMRASATYQKTKHRKISALGRFFKPWKWKRRRAKQQQVAVAATVAAAASKAEAPVAHAAFNRERGKKALMIQGNFCGRQATADGQGHD
jgi:hypothetical protein